eukprot:SAG31_NODE_179_length_21090_cov_11.862871_8_plen_63_part_00
MTGTKFSIDGRARVEQGVRAGRGRGGGRGGQAAGRLLGEGFFWLAADTRGASPRANHNGGPA